MIGEIMTEEMIGEIVTEEMIGEIMTEKMITGEMIGEKYHHGKQKINIVNK